MLQDLQRAASDIAQPVPDMGNVGRRDGRSNNSWMHNLPILAKGPFRCTALVNPADAQRLGLADGSLARISNRSRSIEAQMQISDEMMRVGVSLPHGWAHGPPGTRMLQVAERPGANLNTLLDEDWRDPLSGNAVLSGVPVELSAV